MPGSEKKRSADTDDASTSKKQKTSASESKTAPSSGPSAEFTEKINQARLTAGSSITDFSFHDKRMRVITGSKTFKKGSAVLYWMNRDQRIQDNWAMLYAQKVAMEMEVPLHICFCLNMALMERTIRHFGFMLRGLQHLEKECQKLDISFHLLSGEPKDVVANFATENDVCGVVTDFSPLRVPTQWVTELGEALKDKVPLHQVDAHNIVPCWEASPKLEYGARTIRNKIHNLLSGKNGFLTEFPPVVKHPHKPKSKAENDWKSASLSLSVDKSVPEVTWAKPSTQEALKMLETFVNVRLKNFATDRNNPNKNALSNLSPWIHFGQLSVQRSILTVSQHRGKYKEAVDAYVEEAVIRRELADNFCYYNEHYDSVKGAYAWAKKTLKDHSKDKREYLYTREELEESKTHDDLWNAAQIQLVQKGKMHGFLRMYWAKKILEWTESPKKALEIALYFNDHYSLDGNDPNGFVGCMWSICGIHDQGWAERPVFGKIRYMNYKGCQRKFDVNAFVQKYGAKAYKYTKKN